MSNANDNSKHHDHPSTFPQNTSPLHSLFPDAPVFTSEEAEALLQKYMTGCSGFADLHPEFRDELLAFLLGKESLKITYDPFFKEIFDPYKHRDRVEALISAILGKKVKIKEILQHEGKRLSGFSSLVILDIVVQLEDGSYLDVEMQKIGYAFPGERTCCYSSDLILRQYDRLYGKYGKKFSYRQMMPVQVIVLMENSAKVFRDVAPHYLHRKQTYYDSGAKVTELSEILYISLDTFHKVVQNNIETPLHAWLTLLSTTDFEAIIKLIDRYPDFLPIYEEIMAFRKKPEKLMMKSSEALQIMDHNTELYMIDQMRQEAEQMRQKTEQMRQENEQMRQKNSQLQKEIEQLRSQLQDKDSKTTNS